MFLACVPPLLAIPLAKHAMHAIPIFDLLVIVGQGGNGGSFIIGEYASAVCRAWKRVAVPLITGTVAFGADRVAVCG